MLRAVCTSTSRAIVAVVALALPAGSVFAFGSTYEIVAFSGQTSPDGRAFGTSLSNPSVGADGTVAFVDNGSGNDEIIDYRLFLGRSGALRRIVGSGDATPGSAGTFISFSRPSVARDGRVGFLGTFSFGEGYGEGVWIGGPQGVSAGLLLSSSEGGSPVAGGPAFRAGTVIGAKVNDGYEGPSALHLGPPPSAPSVLSDGQIVAGQWVSRVSTIASFFGAGNPGNFLDVNESGVAALKVAVSATPAPSPTASPSPSPKGALLAGRPGSFQVVAVEGSPAPDAPGSNLSAIGPDPSIASNGNLAFVALLSESAPNLEESSSKTAVFSGRPGAFRLIVREGDLVPTTTDVRFAGIHSAAVNETGDVVFQASFRYPNGTERDGIWIKRQSGPPVLIAAEGTQLPTPFGIRTVKFVEFAGPGAFNDLHQVAFRAFFDLGRPDAFDQGIYLADTRPLIPWVRATFPRRPTDRVTTARFIEIRGVAEDETGIAQVEYTVERQPRARRNAKIRPVPRLAKGDRRWMFRVPLAMGVNRITVTAVDKLGNRSEPLVLAVLRYDCRKP